MILLFNPTACSEGFFGKNCSFPCKCKNGASCDPVSGSCRCPPGVSGDLCQDGEPSPYLFRVYVFFFSSIISQHERLNPLMCCFAPCVQAVRRVSTGSSATRSVTVPITGAAIGHMAPVCVILDSTGASATSVSPNIQTTSDNDRTDHETHFETF